MNRIVIVDDHFLLRAGWSYLIDPEDDLEICGAAASASEALRLIENSAPDLVITDLSHHFLTAAGNSLDKNIFPLARLTDRELEIFEKIGRGLAQEEIAAELEIRARTVEAHRSNMRKKLGLTDSNALLRFAVRWRESGQLAD